MATYYVRSSGGSDGNAGTSFGAAFATVQKLADTCVAGDLGLICADGTHLPTAKIDFDTNAGAVGNMIVFRGAASDGTDDGTVATIGGGSLAASNDLFNITQDLLRFEGLRLTAATRHGVYLDSSQTVWRRVRIDNCTTNGIHLPTINDIVHLHDVQIDSNGGWGWNGPFNSRGRVLAEDCSIHHNSGGGVYLSQTGYYMHRCRIYRNGGDGVRFQSTQAGAENHGLSECTIFANTGDGIDCQSSGFTLLRVSKTILRSNGGYGINLNSGDKDLIWCHDVCSHNNTSGHTDVNSGTLVGWNIVTEDPQFTTETDGSEDLTPVNANLLLSKDVGGGTDYLYIGAIQPQGGSGGGLLRHPGMQGGLNG